MLFHENITSKAEMVAWLDKRRPSKEKKPRNGEEMAISRVNCPPARIVFRLLYRSGGNCTTC